MDRSWDERQAALVGLELDQMIGPWRVNPAYDDGADLLAVTGDMALEGVVAEGSRYRPGLRTRWWVKCNHLQRGWMDVLGWQRPTRSRPGRLIVGEQGHPAGITVPALPPAERHILLDVIHRHGAEHRDRICVPPAVIEADVTYLERSQRGLLRHATVRAVRAAAGAAEPI
jgi:ATP-dependent DNA ligase